MKKTADASASSDGHNWPPFMRQMMAAVQHTNTRVISGQVLAVSGTIVKARLPGVQIGEICELRDNEWGQARIADVIGLEGEVAFLAPYGNITGLSQRTEVIGLQRSASIVVSDELLGAVLDGFGNIVEPPAEMARPQRPTQATRRPIFAAPPPPMARRPISEAMSLGIRAIDGLATCGRGQRLGVFGNAGVGKSTLISEVVSGTTADIVIVALIGERGREVGDFLRRVLTPERRARTIIVASTSDRPPVERMKAAQLATTLAEHYRDHGMHVLLVLDSVTRFARAQREIGLSAGEVPARRGFPPSVFTALPQLFERSGAGATGSITGLYTVLVEGDISLDPIAEEAKSLLDGHIVLSDKLAAMGHFPAIDILESRSRLMDHIISAEQRQAANQLREQLSRYNEVELLIRVGEYRQGQDSATDRAIRLKPGIDAFLKQGLGERHALQECVSWLKRTVEMP